MHELILMFQLAFHTDPILNQPYFRTLFAKRCVITFENCFNGLDEVTQKRLTEKLVLTSDSSPRIYFAQNVESIYRTGQVEGLRDDDMLFVQIVTPNPLKFTGDVVNIKIMLCSFSLIKKLVREPEYRLSYDAHDTLGNEKLLFLIEFDIKIDQTFTPSIDIRNRATSPEFRGKGLCTIGSDNILMTLSEVLARTHQGKEFIVESVCVNIISQRYFSESASRSDKLLQAELRLGVSNELPLRTILDRHIKGKPRLSWDFKQSLIEFMKIRFPDWHCQNVIYCRKKASTFFHGMPLAGQPTFAALARKLTQTPNKPVILPSVRHGFIRK